MSEKVKEWNYTNFACTVNYRIQKCWKTGQYKDKEYRVLQISDNKLVKTFKSFDLAEQHAYNLEGLEIQ